MDDQYRALIESSPRVSSDTRRLLLERGRPDEPQYVPRAMTETAFATLRALLDRVIPQTTDVAIDLAARLDSQLFQGGGDGWRNASLPPDRLAYEKGLHTLNEWAITTFAQRFAHLNPDSQESLLERMAEPRVPGADSPGNGSTFASHHMTLWFEDVRADAVRLYMAHPETLSRIGYSGIANGGDGVPKSGFLAVGINERENWEPIAQVEPPS